jgi:hypothetical protein
MAFNLITVAPGSIENRVIAIPDEQPAIPSGLRVPRVHPSELQPAGRLQAA